jgi:hypothetical protein
MAARRPASPWLGLTKRHPPVTPRAVDIVGPGDGASIRTTFREALLSGVAATSVPRNREPPIPLPLTERTLLAAVQHDGPAYGISQAALVVKLILNVIRTT